MTETPHGTVIDLFTSIGRQKYYRAMIRAMPARHPVELLLILTVGDTGLTNGATVG